MNTSPSMQQFRSQAVKPAAYSIRLMGLTALLLTANTLMAAAGTTTTGCDEATVLAARADYQQISYQYPQPRRSALVAQAMQSLLVNETLAMLDETDLLTDLSMID